MALAWLSGTDGRSVGITSCRMLLVEEVALCDEMAITFAIELRLSHILALGRPLNNIERTDRL